MPIPALGGATSRLAKLATIPVVGLVLAACTTQENTNPTSDDAGPNLFGETSNGIGFPHEVVTTEGIASASLYLPIFLVAVAIFLIVEGILLYVVWRYRRKDGDDSLPEQTHGNNRLEVIWTVIPAIIVTVMFVGSTLVLIDIEDTSDEPVAVLDVEAFRFGWIYDYLDPATFDPETNSYEPLGIQIAGGGREGAPEIFLPTDGPVKIRLSAADVIHSWYVPAFFFKRDAIPGRVNEFDLTIEVPGVYGGQCAEFCGTAHGDMYFTVNALEPGEYEAWVAEQTGGATTADATEGEDATDTADSEEGTEMSEEAA